MRASLLQTMLVALMAAGLGQAQFLISELSFGFTGRMSPPESPGKIPGFTISGQFSEPELLSNKLILTPMAPGNQRASIWSDGVLLHDSFIVDVDFRANGPERAGGSLNIWLAFDGSKRVGSRGVYTVNRFEGLVLAIDSHGGGGSGMLRGFLNDGSVDYASSGRVDELAFGHCKFAYRNLGRPSQVKMRQTAEMFSVEIDGHTCFESSKVRIPSGYQVGVTAVTPDIPDSFEIFKVVTMSDSPKVSVQRQSSNENSNSNSNSDNDNSKDTNSNSNSNSNNNNNNNANKADGSWENPADEDADVFQTSKAQFQDLHHRLQVTNHQLSALFRTVGSHHQLAEKRHDELVAFAKDLQSLVGRLGSAQDLQSRIDRLEAEVRSLKGELSQKISDNERAFRGLLSGHHDSLSRRMVDSVPGHGRLITVIVGINVVFAGVYVFYKRRKSMPKKYL